MASSQGDYFSAPASFPALAFFCALASAFHSRVTRQRSRSFAARRDILSNRIFSLPVQRSRKRTNVETKESTFFFATKIMKPWRH